MGQLKPLKKRRNAARHKARLEYRLARYCKVQVTQDKDVPIKARLKFKDL